MATPILRHKPTYLLSRPRYLQQFGLLLCASTLCGAECDTPQCERSELKPFAYFCPLPSKMLERKVQKENFQRQE